MRSSTWWHGIQSLPAKPSSESSAQSSAASPAKPPSATPSASKMTTTRREIHGRAFAVYLNNKLVNVLGGLSEHEVASLQQESVMTTPVARIGVQWHRGAKLLLK